ncbi:MAG: D-alanine--D-alanine ligase [Proteobacteria bacterium]|nr:D-alanine--D-alanine ligase [Pseudomonadota bacterium]
MKIKKILLLSGGPSRERKVSISSGKAVYYALRQLKYNVVRVDPSPQYSNFKKYNCDIAFNALHGQFGEDGIIQSILEKQKIPYTHSGVKSSATAMDKIKSKKKFIINNIKTPKFKVIKKLSDLNNKISKNKFVLKPINEGSSVGVLIYKNIKDINQLKIKNSLNKYKQLLQEEFIEGKEVQAAVMGNKAIGAIEIRPNRKFYDYNAKYSLKAKTKHIMPADLEKKTYKKVLQLALKAHQCLKCKGITRSDFRVTKDNKIFILETNTQPGMTNLSLVPEIAEYKGISFKQLVKWIVLDASLNR